MASQQTMSGQNKELSSQTLALTVILTRHIKLDLVAKNIVQKNKLLHYEYIINSTIHNQQYENKM